MYGGTNGTFNGAGLTGGSVGGGAIAGGAVSKAKTNFPGTLDQVGINKSDIATLKGYFTGSANFSALNARVFWLNGMLVNRTTIKDYYGTRVYVLTAS